MVALEQEEEERECRRHLLRQRRKHAEGIEWRYCVTCMRAKDADGSFKTNPVGSLSLFLVVLIDKMDFLIGSTGSTSQVLASGDDGCYRPNTWNLVASARKERSLGSV